MTISIAGLYGTVCSAWYKCTVSGTSSVEALITPKPITLWLGINWALF